MDRTTTLLPTHSPLAPSLSLSLSLSLTSLALPSTHLPHARLPRLPSLPLPPSYPPFFHLPPPSPSSLPTTTNGGRTAAHGGRGLGLARCPRASEAVRRVPRLLVNHPGGRRVAESGALARRDARASRGGVRPSGREEARGGRGREGVRPRGGASENSGSDPDRAGRVGRGARGRRPAPPGEICAPRLARLAPPCAPGLTRVTSPGHPASPFLSGTHSTGCRADVPSTRASSRTHQRPWVLNIIDYLSGRVAVRRPGRRGRGPGTPARLGHHYAVCDCPSG
jgi:hypothetical protein